jgi:PPOX class probable F420-dependent enzyme
MAVRHSLIAVPPCQAALPSWPALRNPGDRPLVASFYRMHEPTATRPYMPGYGMLPATGGSGLLPWSWAVARLARSHDYWLATVTPQGAPHLMPVWAVWHADLLWFSSANGSRKARNLTADTRCTVSTDNPQEPVVVHGLAERVTSPGALAAMLAAENAKYRTSYGPEMVDPARNSVYALRPDWVFALDASDFTGSPTRFTFGPAAAG